MLRKLTFVAMGMVLACGSMVLSSPTAYAASYDGDLRFKGPGSTAYTQGPFISLVGIEGSTLSYTLQVRNTGPTVAQFRMHAGATIGGAPFELYEGTLRLTPLATGPDGYYTKALAPGGSQVLTAKITIPTGSVGFQYAYGVVLYATDGTYLDEVTLLAEEAASPGTTGYDMLVRAGSQKNVGAGHDVQNATAGTISSTGTAKFTVTLQNNSGGPTSIFFAIADALSCGNFVVTVKQGTKNVTAAAFAGTYQTPVLAPGNQRVLSVTVKAAGTSCPWDYWKVAAGPTATPIGQRSNLIVNLAG